MTTRDEAELMFLEQRMWEVSSSLTPFLPCVIQQVVLEYVRTRCVSCRQYMLTIEVDYMISTKTNCQRCFTCMERCRMCPAGNTLWGWRDAPLMLQEDLCPNHYMLTHPYVPNWFQSSWPCICVACRQPYMEVPQFDQWLSETWLHQFIFRCPRCAETLKGTSFTCQVCGRKTALEGSSYEGPLICCDCLQSETDLDTWAREKRNRGLRNSADFALTSGVVMGTLATGVSCLTGPCDESLVNGVYFGLLGGTLMSAATFPSVISQELRNRIRKRKRVAFKRKMGLKLKD